MTTKGPSRKQVIILISIKNRNKFIESLSSYITNLISDTVHTGCESLQEGLGDMQTCGMTLALTYMLCHLSIVWLQLQILERNLR